MSGKNLLISKRITFRMSDEFLCIFGERVTQSKGKTAEAELKTQTNFLWGGNYEVLRLR